MAWTNHSALVAAVAAFGASAYLLIVGMKDRERLQLLEQQVEELREAKEELERNAAQVAQAPPSPPVDPVVTSAASELSEKSVALREAAEKLDQTAKVLDSRIVRSRLAVPDEKERAAQFERGHKRLEELRKAATEAREKARQIAVDSKVPFDEKRLLELGANPVLEANADFVAARDTAAAQMRMVEQFEKKLTELHFSTVVDALPQ